MLQRALQDGKCNCTGGMKSLSPHMLCALQRFTAETRAICPSRRRVQAACSAHLPGSASAALGRWQPIVCSVFDIIRSSLEIVARHTWTPVINELVSSLDHIAVQLFIGAFLFVCLSFGVLSLLLGRQEDTCIILEKQGSLSIWYSSWMKPNEMERPS